jgi:hypothetical protein
MWLTSFLSGLNGRPGRSPQARRRPGRGKPGAPRRSFLPRLDCLEDRAVPSTVTSPLDDSTSGTLRAALASTPAGGVIDFNLPAGQNTIKLTQGDLVLTKNVTILGGAGVTVQGDSAHRVFEVNTGVWATLDSLTMIGGVACYGGGVYNAGNLLLNKCVIENNWVAPNYKAGAAYAEGGGIFNTGYLDMVNCTVNSNAAVVPNDYPYSNWERAQGGGIYNRGWLWLSGCTLHDNYSDNDGGGIYNTITTGGGVGSGGGLAMSNCTIAYNHAYNVGGGIADMGVLAVTNCTIAKNTADFRGAGLAIGDAPAAVYVANTIIAGNTDAPGWSWSSIEDVWGTVQSFGCNLITSLSGASGFKQPWGAGADADWLWPDAKLGALVPHGGPTVTMNLLPGSPAIGNGSPNLAKYLGLDLQWHPLTTDQRGLPRVNPATGKVDIGAYQTQGNPDTSAGNATLKKQAVPPHGQSGSSPAGALVGPALYGSQLVAAAAAGGPSGRTINVAATPVATVRAALTDEVFAGWARQPRSGEVPQEGRSLPGSHGRGKLPALDDLFAWLASGQPFQAGRLGG